MANEKPIILKDGKFSEMKAGVDLIDPALLPSSSDDFLSGTDLIATSQTLTIPINKQSINFTMLTIDGTLTLDGDLWLA